MVGREGLKSAVPLKDSPGWRAQCSVLHARQIHVILPGLVTRLYRSTSCASKHFRLSEYAFDTRPRKTLA